MAVAEMRKVFIMGEINLREKVIKRLEKLALFQPEPMDKDLTPSVFKKNEIKTQQIEENLSKIGSAIDFLGQFEEKKFDLGLFPNKILVQKDDYLKWTKEFKWDEFYKKCLYV